MDPTKREHILDCADRLFSRSGYRATSVARIAAEAGVAKGTIYLAADSKRDLFFQVLHRLVREVTAATARVIDPRRPAVELLPIAVGADLEHFDERPLVRELLVGRAARSVADQAEGFDAFDELRHLARANLRDIVALGQRQGRFRDDLDPDQVAILVQDLEVAALLFHDDVDGIGSPRHPRWTTALAIFTRGLLRATPPTHHPTTTGDPAHEQSE